MTRRNLSILAAIVAGLILLLVALDQGDDGVSSGSGTPLLPGFKARANDVSRIDISTGGTNGTETVTIRREAGSFVVSSRDGYPADTGRLRQLVVTLAEASVLEEKTSKPELYERLGVDDPKDGGSGTRIELAGPDFDYAVVLGDRAQSAYQYARIPGDAKSYLIDRAAEIPDAGSDWLAPGILDIDAEEIASVSIRHADGESLAIDKASADLTDFTVQNVPSGRELSYATVGNGIAGALAALTLEDVRWIGEPAPDAATVAIFETWDGITLKAALMPDGDATWVSFSAEPGSGDTTATTALGEPAGKTANSAATDTETATRDAASVDSEIATLNERLSGWQFRIADYKRNLLSRRWNDILKAEDSD